MCDIEENNSFPDCCGKASNSENVRLFSSFGLIAVLLGLFGTVYIMDKVLPTPLTIKDEQIYPNAFITERARHDLKILTDIGPKQAGTYPSEILAAHFLENTINDIIQEANSVQKLELAVQSISEQYYDAEGHYSNIIVKVFAKNNVSHSVLINSHFDSVVSSPEAGGDGINCVMMLELLRKLSKETKRPSNNLIFLFNGAEEFGLIGSRSFIQEHKWANESKVFINLDAIGNGGKIILFQVTPGATWLLDYYTQVPHPYGQTAAEELYQSGLFMSNTDYTIFTVIGQMVGFDLAFFKNAERYHTKEDTYEHIPPGSLQHVGDNVLSLVRSLGNAPEVTNLRVGSQRIIYYDFLGLFMITYTESLGSILNFCVSLMSIVVFFLNLRSFQLKCDKQSVKFFVISFGTIFGGWVVATLSVVTIAFLLNQIGYSRTWHSNPWIFLGLYSAPSVACSSLLLPYATHNKVTENMKSQIQAHFVRIIWTFTLIVGTVFQIRSMYLLFVPIFFNTFCFLLIYILKWQYSANRWEIIYLVSQIIPTMFLMYAALLMLSLLIPISVGMKPSISTVAVGLPVLLFAIVITSPFVPLANLVKDFKYMHIFFAVVFLVHFITIFTPLFELF